MKEKLIIRLHLILLLFLFMDTNVYSQDEKKVTLVVTGEARTKDEAIAQALRNAIEQSFGTFVSSNTKMINDEIIRDEIVSISKGNILNYKEISELTMADGNKSVTVQATVSISNLTNYANNKGMQAELSGAVFLMNKRIEEFNTKNEKIALNNTIEQYARVLPKLFDLQISTQDPIEKDGFYRIPCVVKFIANKNTLQAHKLWVDALAELNVGFEYSAHTATLKNSGSTTPYFITFENFHDKIRMGNINVVETTNLKMYFRNDNKWVVKKMQYIFNDLLLDSYCIRDNFGIHLLRDNKIIEDKESSVKIEFGDLRPVKTDCRWYFDSKNHISLPTLNKTIDEGMTMYEQMIYLVYTEEQMNKLSKISIEPNANFDFRKIEYLNNEDYVSPDGLKHYLFGGVYLDGSLDRVVKSLKEKGYTLISKTDNNSAKMKGNYLGDEVELTILTTKSEHIVYGINVAFPLKNQWVALKSDYLRLKDHLSAIGEVSVTNEKFIEPYYDGCGKEMEAVVIPQGCLYSSVTSDITGYTTVIINNDKKVYLLFRDFENFRKRDK